MNADHPFWPPPSNGNFEVRVVPEAAKETAKELVQSGKSPEVVEKPSTNNPKKPGAKPKPIWGEVARVLRQFPDQSEKDFQATVLRELRLTELPVKTDSFNRKVRDLKKAGAGAIRAKRA
ncbi:MAG: hypothetical protein KF833_08485 [Verrucomicrobiae bacterium]|nr:hypothetical protein [Verrucomicrobiae bacterium]